eukprot:gene18250-5791_t
MTDHKAAERSLYNLRPLRAAPLGALRKKPTVIETSAILSNPISTT